MSVRVKFLVFESRTEIECSYVYFENKLFHFTGLTHPSMACILILDMYGNRMFTVPGEVEDDNDWAVEHGPGLIHIRTPEIKSKQDVFDL